MLSNSTLQLCVCIVPVPFAKYDSGMRVKHSVTISAICVIGSEADIANEQLKIKPAKFNLERSAAKQGAVKGAITADILSRMLQFVHGCRPHGQVGLQLCIVPVLSASQHLLNAA